MHKSTYAKLLEWAEAQAKETKAAIKEGDHLDYFTLTRWLALDDLIARLESMDETGINEASLEGIIEAAHDNTPEGLWYAFGELENSFNEYASTN